MGPAHLVPARDALRQLGGGAVGDDWPGVQDDDPIGKPLRLGKIVGGGQDRRPPLRGQALKERVELAPCLGSKPAVGSSRNGD